jgi:hypothetical protein
MSDQEDPEKDKSDQSDEDQIQEQLEGLREGYNDQRIFNAVSSMEYINLIDDTHADVEEWFLIFDEDQPILRCTHAKWSFEKEGDEWVAGDWAPEDDIFAVDVTKGVIPWGVLEKETCISSDDAVSEMGMKFAEGFDALFYKGEECIPDPSVVVDPILRKELESYRD